MAAVRPQLLPAGASPYPDGDGPLDRLRLHSDSIEVEEPPVKIHHRLRPERAHQLDVLVRARGSLVHLNAKGFELLGEFAPRAYAQNSPSARQQVQSNQLLGKPDRVR